MRSVILAAALSAAALLPVMANAWPQAATPKVRIGTYDSRAVAVAYAASRFNPVAAKVRELEAAKASGDARKVAELEAWGPAHQRALHRQGFGRVPVDDLLAHVEDRLSEAAREAGVEAIVFSAEWTAEGVQVIDVTSEVVALFEPSERTLAMIADLRNKAPLDLDEVEKHQSDH